MGRIVLEGMEFFAYHGHYAEEKESGTRFLADVWLDVDTYPAGKSDNIDDALNYQEAYVCVRKIIEKGQYNLLEAVALNCLNALFEKFNNLETAGIKITKVNPAMGGHIAGVSVSMEKHKK
ncbi:MAG: dihydroneopterin aldolase [Bacteroidales bacterium]|nr:dihydroneopterin aldolase [Bacteroidales bacterium]